MNTILIELQHMALRGIDATNLSELARIDPIGMILLREPMCWGYWCTPVNTITFATTGGDGVHYGLLAIDGVISNASPVIVTLPCARTCNIVVGETLHDFLRLGSKVGYFVLEQIEYQPSVYIPLLDSGTHLAEMEDEEVDLLQQSTKKLSLEPWPHHESKFNFLKREYLPMLQYPDEYHDITADRNDSSGTP